MKGTERLSTCWWRTFSKRCHRGMRLDPHIHCVGLGTIIYWVECHAYHLNISWPQTFFISSTSHPSSSTKVAFRQAASTSSRWCPKSASWIIPWCRNLTARYTRRGKNQQGLDKLDKRKTDFRNNNVHQLGPFWNDHRLQLPSGNRLELHERFECGGGWGLERSLNKWACSQPWRKVMPLDFFKSLTNF